MKKTLTIVLGLFCICGLLSAQEAPEKAQRGGKDRSAKMAEKQLTRIKDGATKIIEKFDTDKDGTLSAAEKEGLETTIENAKEVLKMYRVYEIIKVVDTDGNLVISDEEAKEAPKKIGDFLKARRQEMGKDKQGGNREKKQQRERRPEPEPEPEEED
ncbi:MAG: hypothetical protein WCS73_04140 [Lentisphaeria bacterium]